MTPNIKVLLIQANAILCAAKCMLMRRRSFKWHCKWPRKRVFCAIEICDCSTARVIAARQAAARRHLVQSSSRGVSPLCPRGSCCDTRTFLMRPHFTRLTANFENCGKIYSAQSRAPFNLSRLFHTAALRNWSWNKIFLKSVPKPISGIHSCSVIYFCTQLMAIKVVTRHLVEIKRFLNG